MIHTLDLQSFVDALDGDVLIIDVREADEFTAAHLDGALNLPLSDIAAHDLSGVSPDKKILVHCAAGMRSHQACLYWGAKYPDLTFYNVNVPFASFAGEGLKII